MAQNKKKIIIFIPSIEDGGVEKNLYLIANFLSTKLDNIFLLTYDKLKEKKFSKQIKIINPLFNFIDFKGRYLKYFFCLLLLIRMLIFNRNFLIFSFQANIFTIIIAQLFNVKVISRSNSSSIGWSRNFLKQLIFKYYFKKADEIIVNSYDFKKEMDKKYNIKTKCILNPFEFTKIDKLSKKKVKKIFKTNTLKLISVGRLTDQKDFITLLKCLKFIKRKVELAIIGKGSEQNKLKNFIFNNKLNKKVKLLGYKLNPFPYLKQADIFILTSKFEGLPNVLIEAQYLKKFIISTNCPTGPNEILKRGKYGALFEVGDYKNISKFIDNFQFSKKNNKKIIDGYMGTKRFDYHYNCSKYLRLIHKYL
jgi:glycosyltransferase involved in cell wall biosynthesis